MGNTNDGRIFVRRPEQTHVPDVEADPSAEWIHNAILQMVSSLQGLKRVLDDRTKPVDEYVPQNASSSQNSVTLQPQFEMCSERITSILYWGPPAATGSITLGDMTIPIVVPATGYGVIAPVSLLLDRNSTRTITLGTAGDMGMRLMGWADDRY